MTTVSIESAKLPRIWTQEAKKLFLQYRKAVADHPEQKEYRELMHAYHQQSMGKTVISLNKAMQLGGSRPNGQPLLAIAHASAKWCYFVPEAGWIHDSDRQWRHAAVAFVSEYDINPGRRRRSYDRESRTNCFRFLRPFFPVLPKNEICARVPLIPPSVRPRHSLDNYCILWEANWEAAPIDPYLLRRITKDLFVVLAQWDLTEAERLILEMAIVS